MKLETIERAIRDLQMVKRLLIVAFLVGFAGWLVLGSGR